ncbi:beta transducin [Malassezia yamatoensis]|uniref:Beta transducin n=1 Tax=Malassezia yamatoensis TaxID=253288 RepID=A0AAJ5YPD9_9BASI|nr:beta transducin [Malassezia yamatoensis]
MAVTAIASAPYPNDHRFAVGYADGSIRLWDINTQGSLLTFNGHQRAVTSLAFDAVGVQLASGSQDTTVIVWDTVAEQGLFRLKSHHDAITGVHLLSDSEAPSENASYLLTTSKDGLLKLWDLRLQHCIETVVSGDEQLYSLAVSTQLGDEPNDALIVTAGSNGNLRLWKAQGKLLKAGLRASDTSEPRSRFIESHGQAEMPTSHRVSQVAFSAMNKSDTLLGALSGDRAVYTFRLRTLEEAKKKQQRRYKRAKEKAEKGSLDAADIPPSEVEITWAMRIEPYVVVRPSIGRIRSFSFANTGEPTTASNIPTTLLCALTTNSAELYTIPAIPRTKEEKRSLEAQLTSALELPGHRSDVRALALSSDDSLLASVCGTGQLKVWNVMTGRCIRTLAISSYALCVTWLPGDRYVLVGCKDGTLHTFDVPAGLAIETLEAHQGPIWSCIVHPDGLSAVTCSADKEVRFWEFEMVQPEQDEQQEAESAGVQQLSLIHTRTLKVTDDVLCARHSPNGKLLAISLLDNTVKVFYADTLKFFLSLYGHKLPVLALDISDDSKLCVTCSADKNVKIWGLDFGDCHKSIFAHDDSIMNVAFEHGMQGGGLMGGREGASHRFWTVSKDSRLKYWDGDRFVLIQTLQGHHSEIWALATGTNGKVVVTAGSDRSIRLWEKTGEPLFLEEEREKELEEIYETAAVPPQEELGIGELAENAEENPKQASAEASAVSKTSTESLMAGERLLDAITIASEDLAQRNAAEKAGQPSNVVPINPVIQAVFREGIEEVDTHKYVLRVVEKIAPTHLEDALLVLPFDRVVTLMTFIDVWVSKEWNVSLAARILFFLMRVHHAQIVSNRVMRTALIGLRKHLRDVLAKQKTMLGFNLAALRYLRQQEVANRTAELLEKSDVPLDQLDEKTIREKIDANSKRKRKLVIR